MDDSEIVFTGPGPFYLPVAQKGSAHGDQNNGVTLTIHALVQRAGDGESQRTSGGPDTSQGHRA